MNTTSTKAIPAVACTIADTSLTLTFASGDTLVLHAAVLSDEIRQAALLHGLKQKLIDAAAIGRNPDTGRSATAKEKFEAVNEVYMRLLDGEWNKGREGGSASNGGLLARALVQMTGKTPEQIKAFLDGKTDKEKAALRANLKVAAIIDTLRAASAKSSEIDTDAMLGELI